MTRRTITTPQDDARWHALRGQDVTSTESAALFDMSPYLTRYELYHRKRDGLSGGYTENERMRWGLRLEDAIARGIAEDYGVKVRRLNSYQSLTGARMGASFDFEIVGLLSEWDGGDATVRDMYAKHGVGNFEIKSVDFLVFRDQWTINPDKSIEAPAHIEIQVQHQLHVSGRHWSAIGLLVAGNTPKIVIRERDAEVGQSIEARIAELYALIDAGAPPQPSFPKDAEFVCQLHNLADPGRVYDGRDDEELALHCANYQRAQVAEKLAGEDKSVAKALILMRIGTAEKAMLADCTISAGVVAPGIVAAYERRAYRGFRITTKKAKAETMAGHERNGTKPIGAIDIDAETGA